ncbi:MAG TPA: HNH endonuclease [Ktedonobacteraceae bacterium]
MKHSIYLRSMILLSVMALVICGCSSVTITTGGGSSSGVSTTGSSSTGNTGSGGTNSGNPSTAEPNWGVQMKTSGCHARGALEDPACTPGDIIKTATKAKICVSGYAGSVRNVPTSEKNQVYAEYGILSHTTGQYEVDHHVSLELGGSNNIANLWPEAASPKPGFHEKDKVENYLHSQVCSGAISLKQAQIEIATNWLAVYNSMPSK